LTGAIAIFSASISAISLMAMVPLQECRMPTGMGGKPWEPEGATGINTKPQNAMNGMWVEYTYV
jgi:hypothetical protein